MLLDVLETLATWPHRPEVGIVTSDPFALQLARSISLHRDSPTTPIAAKPMPSKLATRFCESQGVDSTLVIPGDIPLIQSWELEKILAAAPAEGSVLVPAADGRGTNAILAAPRRPVSRALRQRQLQAPLRCGPAQPENPASCSPCRALHSMSTTRPTCSALAAPRVKPDAQRLIRQWDLADFPWQPMSKRVRPRDKQQSPEGAQERNVTA